MNAAALDAGIDKLFPRTKSEENYREVKEKDDNLRRYARIDHDLR